MSDKVETQEPEITSVEKVDHADGTYTIIVQYEGAEGVRLYPPHGKKRLDFQDQTERNEQAEHWEAMVKPHRRSGRQTKD